MSELQDALNKVRYPTATQKYPVVAGEPLAVIVKAARLVANGKRVEWCDTHQEPLADSTSIHIVEDDCQMVPKLLIDPPEKT